MFARLMDGDGWHFRFYPDDGVLNFARMAGELAACDIAYQIGGRVTTGRFLRAARLLNKRKIVMHWAGTDALDGRGQVGLGNADPWVRQELKHWAECNWMVEEVRELGLPCECVPLPSCHIPVRPSPMPTEFSVLVYLPSVERAQLYGLDRMLAVAGKLPQVRFELVGLKEGLIQGPPPNLVVHGWLPEPTRFYQRATVLWRPTRHDGKSFMVMEALGHGRHVLWSRPFPGCETVTSAMDAEQHLSRLYALHQRGRLPVNDAGAKLVADSYRPYELKKQILLRLESLLDS